jgi:hypothetical protein
MPNIYSNGDFFASKYTANNYPETQFGADTLFLGVAEGVFPPGSAIPYGRQNKPRTRHFASVRGK